MVMESIRMVQPASRRCAMLVLAAVAGGAAGLMAAPSSQAAEESTEIPSLDWSFSGPFGTYDPAQLQRGYKVYQEVCSACHGLKLLSYRNLGQTGGPGFSPGQVSTLAAEAQVTAGPNDEGEMIERPGRPSDRFVSPYPNEQAARAANGGALPPDLSVIAKARPGGPNYIYSLLTGYGEPPAGVKVMEGMNYNAAFPGHQISMPPPLSDGQVEYSDNAPQTVPQYAKDLAAFLMWAAEPKLDERHALGLRMMIYLSLLIVLLYLAKRKIWSRVEH